MKRLIESKFIKKIKSLFTSLWTDDNGNVEIGKDLEVDGKIFATSLTRPLSDAFGVKFFQTDNGTFIFGNFYKADGKYNVTGLIVIDSNYAILAQDAKFDPETEEVDGGTTIYINELQDAINKFRHHLRLSGTGATAVADFYSVQTLVCDSLQDLSTLTHDDAFAVSGGEYIEAKKTGGVWQLVKADGTAVNVTAVTDAVTAMD